MMSSDNEKIGIGIITYNRPKLFAECVRCLPDADVTVVVNDGDPYPSEVYPPHITKTIQHKINIGVGRSKNQALKYLMHTGCTHLFLCEDDIRIVHPDLCRAYIRASEESGIKHFNYAYHGSENKTDHGELLPARKVKQYENNVAISFHRHILGAFQYFHRDVLTTCGYFDPFYKNALEHIDHTYRIINHGYHPPFWWFADIAESSRFIEDLDPEHAASTIRTTSWKFRARARMVAFYFMVKHGTRIWHIPDVNENKVDEVLLKIQRDHARKYPGVSS